MIEVENGHLLSKHPDKCRFPHGHTRKVELIFEADTLDDREMVFDFKLISRMIGDFLETYDHALCMNTEDPKFEFFKEAYGDSYDLYKYDDGSSEVENTEMVLIISPGVGFDFGKFALMFEMRYELGLTEVFKNEESWEAGKNRVITFMAGISF